MKRNIGKVLLACAFAAATVFGAATASGGYAYETEYHDDNGNMVGLHGYDCDFGRYRWGVVTVNTVIYDYGPCD